MAVHVLHAPGHNVVVRCHSSEADSVKSTLTDNGFRCGTVNQAVGIPQLVDFNVARDEYGSHIEGNELRELFKGEGFDVA